MLGFAPISGQAISGSPSALVAIPAHALASLGISFPVSGRPGALFHAKASIGINFALSPHLIVHQALHSSVSITFGMNPRLRVAGKPIILSAVPQRYYSRATLARYSATALPERFKTRGAR